MERISPNREAAAESQVHETGRSHQVPIERNPTSYTLVIRSFPRICGIVCKYETKYKFCR